MTNTAPTRDIARAGAALEASGHPVESRGAGRWRLAAGNGAALATTATVEDGWLRLDAGLRARPLPSRRGRARLWELLEANATLPGGVRLVLTGSRRLLARAEAPTAEGVDLDVWVAGALAGLVRAAERWRGQGPPPCKDGEGGPGSGTGDEGPDLSDEVRRLCEEAGWSVIARPSGTLAVPLEVPGESCTADVERGPGRFTVTAELARTSTLSAASRDAWAGLLLTACGVVRLARASAGSRDGHVAAWVEATWPGLPSAAELAHGLAACSVACQLCGREVTALKEEAIATQYLRVRGWSI